MPQKAPNCTHGSRVNRSNKPTSAEQPAEAVPSLLLVLECIKELDEQGIAPTRDLIAQKTGLTLTTVDDRIKVLRGEQIISQQAHCYRPTVRHAPSQPVSATCMGDGAMKIEKGDVVMELTPAEARNLGKLLMGSANESPALTAMASFMDVLATTSTEFLALKAVTRKRSSDGNPDQLPLIS